MQRNNGRNNPLINENRVSVRRRKRRRFRESWLLPIILIPAIIMFFTSLLLDDREDEGDMINEITSPPRKQPYIDSNIQKSIGSKKKESGIRVIQEYNVPAERLLKSYYFDGVFDERDMTNVYELPKQPKHVEKRAASNGFFAVVTVNEEGSGTTERPEITPPNLATVTESEEGSAEEGSGTTTEAPTTVMTTTTEVTKVTELTKITTTELPTNVGDVTTEEVTSKQPIVTTENVTSKQPIVTTEHVTSKQSIVTTELVTEATTKEDTITDVDKTTLSFTDSKATTVLFTTNTPEISTTGAVVAALPIWVFIVPVCAFLLGVLLVLAIWYCSTHRKEKHKITPVSSPFTSQDRLRDIEAGREMDEHIAIVIEREDMVKRALSMGSVIALEFAIAETRSNGLQKENAQLLKKSESKLYEWKRIRHGLDTSLAERDIPAINEYMDRFTHNDMKDETGIFNRCGLFLASVNSAKLDMRTGVDKRDEAILLSSTAAYRSLNIPDHLMSNDKDWKDSVRVLEEIRQEKLLKGRTQEEYRQVLRMAISSRDPANINAAVDAFKNAEVPDTNNDVRSAETALKEIEEEIKLNKATAFEAMVLACQTRNQKDLIDALENCKKYGVSADDIESGENLLPIVKREDELLDEMKVLVKEEDMQKLSDALIVFKTPALQLTDKTGDVRKAEEVLQKLREKDRMRRTKDDVMWRLHSAMAIGDVTAMDGMIRALQNLASAGEDIPESVLLRAMAELESARGQVDYRKRMEALKSAIARSTEAGNIYELEDLVGQMAILGDDKNYTMTADDTRVLDTARSDLNTLKDKRSIRQEIEQVTPELHLAYIPPNLQRIELAVDRLGEAKENSSKYEGLFTEDDDKLLQDSTEKMEDLRTKVEVTEKARENLNIAVENREFISLRNALKEAKVAPFIEREELYQPHKLATFLDPKLRRLDVKNAMRARDIRALENALSDMKAANVDDDMLEEKAKYTLEKLRRREHRKIKMQKKQEKLDAKRKADIDRFTELLTSAMQSRDVDQLQLALEQFEESGYDEEDVEVFSQAEALFDQLKIKILSEKLMDAVERRDIETLEKAIDEIEFGGYVVDVQDEYTSAKQLLYHLRELVSLRVAISEMSRSMISEIHKYPKPPIDVHTVMIGAFVLLGESPKKMKNWTEVQALLGKLGQDSITRRVRVCVPGDIKQQTCDKVMDILKNIKLEEINEISKGAGTFYAWTIAMIKESQYTLNEQQQKEMENYDVLS